MDRLPLIIILVPLLLVLGGCQHRTPHTTITHVIIVNLADPTETWAPTREVVRLPEAGHWVQNEAPEAVNRHLLRFLAKPV